MSEPNARITQGDNPPSDAAVGRWIGKEAHKRWKHVAQMIEKRYPNLFTPEWLFGGKKHGWSLRYKKSKSFCTFIPEKNCFALLIVFGAEERAKVEAVKGELSPRTQEEYDAATTYHDGKWLRLTVDSDKVVTDAMRLLAVKRKPRAID